MDTLFQWLTPMLIGLVSYFLKTTRDQFTESIKHREKGEAELRKDFIEVKESLQKEINALKTSLPLNYVLREDYIRNTASMDNKLDRILERMQGGKTNNA